MKEKLQLFNGKSVRAAWDDEKEEWFFSVVDVVAVLTDSLDPKQYIKKMRSRDPELGAKWGTICTPIEMLGRDGKKRKVQAATTAGVLRLVQSIPSPKAEPFKMWLAQVGSERLDEIADPEKAFRRGAEFYRAKGYPEEWIMQRMMSIKIRKELTDEWKARGIDEEKDYAILTNEMTKAWSGLSVKEYKDLKGLKNENLRDNMTDIELVLNMLAEVTTTTLSRQENPESFSESKSIAKRGGKVANVAKNEYEQTTGIPVVSATNADDKSALAVKVDSNKSDK